MEKLSFTEMPEKLSLPKSAIDKLAASGRSEEEVMAIAFCDINGNVASRKKRKFVQACLEKGYIYVATPKELAIRNIAAAAHRSDTPFDTEYYYDKASFIDGRFIALAPIPDERCDFLIERLKDRLSEQEFEAVMRREGLMGDNPTMQGVCAAMGISVPTLNHILSKAVRKLMTPNGMKLVDLMQSDRELNRDSQDLVRERAMLEQEPTVRRYLQIMKTLDYRKEQLGEGVTGPTELIEDLDLSARAYGCLRRAGFRTVEQLLLTDMAMLKKVRNLGKSCFEEVIRKLGELGYSLEAGEEENGTE